MGSRLGCTALKSIGRRAKHHKRWALGSPPGRRRVRGEPVGGIFVYPRSCFSFRFERADAVLHSVVRGNQYIPT